MRMSRHPKPLTFPAFGMALGLSLFPVQTTFAQESTEGQQTDAIEEVVVTAQYRETSLQDTPLAITALTADVLEARGVRKIVGIAANTPNVNLRRANAAYGNTLQAFIRGIGQRDFNYAFEPGVGLYIDDVYHSTAFGALWDLLDLERAEVLRGPQGTLFGKNSIGGAIVLVTRKPRGDNSGFVEVGYGSYDNIRLRGAYDFPLGSDNLAMRISALSDTSDGYQDQIDFTCDQPDLAGSIPTEAPAGAQSGCKVGTYGGQDTQAMRVALRWTPSERLSLDFTWDYLDDDSEAAANKLLAIGDPDGNLNTVPGSTTGLPPLLGALWNPNENIPNFDVPFDARFLDPDPYRTYGNYRDPLRGFDTGRVSTVESWGASAVISYALNERLNLTSVTAFRTYDGQFSHDPDQSPLALQNVQNFVGSDQFTQELRLSGETSDGKLFFTIGAFYLDLENTLQGLIHIPPIPGTFFGALGFIQDDVIKTDNRSLFTHLEYEINDRYQVFGGLRYTDESKKYAFDHAPELTIPDPAGEPFDRFDWRLGLKYRASDSVMLYTSVSTGFRSGGVNPRPFTDTQFISFGPEDVTSYEIGSKLDLAQGRARLNLAVFYTDFDNRIQSQQTVDTEGAPLTAPTNLGTGKITGYEFELEYNPVDRLHINAIFGQAEFDTNDAAFVGERPVDVPDRTAAAGMEYRFPLGNSGSTLTPRLDWYYQSRVDYAVDNNPLASTESRGLWNFRLAWADDESWTAALEIRNLADKDYYIQKFTLIPFGLGTLEGQPGLPRTWLLSLTRQF